MWRDIKKKDLWVTQNGVISKFQMAPFWDFKGWYHNFPPHFQHSTVYMYNYIQCERAGHLDSRSHLEVGGCRLSSFLSCPDQSPWMKLELNNKLTMSKSEEMFYKISYTFLSFYRPSNVLSFLSSLLRSYVWILSCLLLSVCFLSCLSSLIYSV